MIRGEYLAKPTYEILRQIDEGAVGECHLVYHKVFQQEMVQKTVSLLGLDDAEAFSEPQLLNTLSHKHLVEIREAQFDPDASPSIKAVTFVMPFYEGGSVNRALEDGYRFSLGEAVRITSGLLDALHYLHVENRLVHRDIKPGNIMLDGSLTYSYLGDLGNAARLTDNEDTAARGGSHLYRPPESHLGRYTVRGDVYGAGMVLLETVNGALPYADIDPSDVERRLSQGKQPVAAKLLRCAPHVPPKLRLLIERMINPNPARRPATALAAQQELHSIRHMDWRDVTDSEVSRWEGRWPPSAEAEALRHFEVTATPITSGTRSGMARLDARWRRSNSTKWRRFASLTRYIDPVDRPALGAFFRAVEAAADH